MTKTIQIKVHKDKSYEVELNSPRRDITLRFEDGEWIADIFDSTIKDSDKAHIDSVALPSLGENHISPNWNEFFEWSETL